MSLTDGCGRATVQIFSASSIGCCHDEGVDESIVDEELLQEWDRLSRREDELERGLEEIEDRVFDKYPEFEIAGMVVSDNLKLDRRESLYRRSIMRRMEEYAWSVIETVDTEIAREQQPIIVELDNLNKTITLNERKISDQVKERRAAIVNENAERANVRQFKET